VSNRRHGVRAVRLRKNSVDKVVLKAHFLAERNQKIPFVRAKKPHAGARVTRCGRGSEADSAKGQRQRLKMLRLLAGVSMTLQRNSRHRQGSFSDVRPQNVIGRPHEWPFHPRRLLLGSSCSLGQRDQGTAR